MKSGKTLSELAIELERQSETKKDYIASTEVLEMTDTGEITSEGDTRQEFAVTDHAHTQIAARLDIPAKYYQRICDRKLLNYWQLTLTAGFNKNQSGGWCGRWTGR